uniref:EF-hand domain-containing protein n=1 Tax=Odontella aurita TaxID=265563 RepID=A0A7S4MZL3_9STRA|mmetsp:Transcript_40696/g.122568  ORF Transcript_40696/g.122568 Transcript_40696/m.122568 type:complete len:325 (+) Transcript_40696:23-997(+)
MAKEENAAEEAHAEGDLGTASSKTTKASREKTANTLSNISKNYDLDGDGKLDETEKIMRDYDKDNDGNLDMHEIHEIVKDLQRQKEELDHERKTMLNMRRVIIGLVAFTFILTLAMLGVSVAAAVLAKDTKTDSATSSFTDKNTNKALSTVSAGRRANFEMFRNGTEEGRRSLLAPILPFSGREFRRHRMMEETDNEGDRSLQRAKDDDFNSGDDDDALQFNFDDDEAFDDCKEKAGTITEYDFEDILDAFRNSEESYLFYVTDGNYDRRERMTFDKGWYNRRNEQLFILEDRCRRNKLYHIFECDNGSSRSCDYYTCLRREED